MRKPNFLKAACRQSKHDASEVSELNTVYIFNRNPLKPGFTEDREVEIVAKRDFEPLRSRPNFGSSAIGGIFSSSSLSPPRSEIDRDATDGLLVGSEAHWH